MSIPRTIRVFGWVAAAVVGCAATWASAALGMRIAAYVHCRFGASPLPAPPPPPPEPPPVAIAAKAPRPPAGPAKEERPVEPPVHYERPSIDLRCGDTRYLAIRRSALAYCRKHHDETSSFICPRIVGLLSHCPRNGVALSLICPSQPAGNAQPSCDEADVWMEVVDAGETAPYLNVVHENNRWRVTEVDFDDLERP
ncbi:MAG TPA: hypothetical protein VKQ32_06160 [Polyangia bacterium]|nr:hypothetical protein [Polyangia bacterium]